MTEENRTGCQSTPDHDAVIVGAGLAGTLAALALVKKGCRVALVDLQAEPKPEFRAEQLVGTVVQSLSELGALPFITVDQPCAPVTLDLRDGRIVKQTIVNQFGVPYSAMVRGARAAVSPKVSVTFGRVADCMTTPDRQTVVMSDGTRLSGRLLVLATGLSTALPKRLGFSYRTIRRDHSVALGFDLDLTTRQSAPPSFVQHAASLQDHVDYLAVFRMGEVMRANLFSYQAIGSPWIRQFCCEPTPLLARCMPGLDRVLGPHNVAGPVQTRSNDLRVLEQPARDGVVVVGDAFQTPCPAAGTGIDRLLSDIAALSRYVPAWLSTAGMGQEKIAHYYADADKQAADAEALRIAEYRRAVCTERSFRWAFHRSHVAFRRHLRGISIEAAQAVWPRRAGQRAMVSSSGS